MARAPIAIAALALSSAGCAHARVGPSEPGHLVATVVDEGMGRRVVLRYRAARAPWWLAVDVLSTTTVGRADAPRTVTVEERHLLLHLESVGETDDGDLRYEIEVVKAFVVERGARRDIPVVPGLKNVVVISTDGYWREHTWKIPPGISQKAFDRVRVLVGTYYWSLPPSAVGRGASWQLLGEYYTLDLTTTSNCTRVSEIDAIDADGADMTSGQTCRSGPMTLSGGQIELQDTLMTGKSRVRILFDRWIESEETIRVLSGRLKGNADDAAPFTSRLETRIRLVPPP